MKYDTWDKDDNFLTRVEATSPGDAVQKAKICGYPEADHATETHIGGKEA